MDNQELIKTVTLKAEKWLGPQYDEETRAEVKAMLDADDKTNLIESFYKDLDFGLEGAVSSHGIFPSHPQVTGWFLGLDKAL